MKPDNSASVPSVCSDERIPYPIDWSLPVPDENAHKYSRGKMVLVGGSAAYPGAACLAAWASQYLGAGYTEVFTACENKPIVQSFRPSLVVRSFDKFSCEKLFSSDHPGALVLGPGLETNDNQAKSIFFDALAFCEKPLLLDGGALSWAAENQALVAQRSKRGFDTVLTPHTGEALRLAASLDDVPRDPCELALALSDWYNAAVVLKGSTTYVSWDKVTYDITNGTAALAKAGTGDVLAGVIGALLAQGKHIFSAGVLGATLHAEAGVVASEQLGIISVCAEEVISALPDVLQDWQEEDFWYV